MAEVTEIVEDKVKVKFNQDDVPSALEYPKLISYSPKIGDKVLMLKTNTSYICLGGIGAEAEEQKEDNTTISGRNEKGTYIKYADGTMICSGTISITGKANLSWGGWKAILIEASDLPMNFIGKPDFSAAHVGSVTGIVVSMGGSATETPTFYVMRPEEGDTTTYSISYTAIGRWKE